MTFEKINFLTSAAKLNQCPDDLGSEIAFVGKSNAGKSTAINVITNRKSIAKTSKTPGRTQLINFFTLEDNRRLVDLPGYGFAKASKAKQKLWGRLVSDYLESRGSLNGVILIIDIRRGVGKMDRMFLDFFLPLNKKLHILLTKSDKLNKHHQLEELKEVKNAYGSIATVQVFSGLKKTGDDIAREVITSMLDNPN